NLQLKNGFYGDLNYYGASEIFLDEANSVQAPAYHLAGLKLGYRTRLDRWQLDLYLGKTNLLDETYSLGNDINAAGGRYYNAAPGRNYFAGAALSWHK